MDTNHLLLIVAEQYNINYDELILFVNKSCHLELSRYEKEFVENSKSKTIILPFCNFIYKDHCNGVIYNHGLYTQCNNIADNLCKKCIKNLKYGTIQERSKHELGKFVSPLGKKEVDYEHFIKKMDYNIDDVIAKLKSENLTYTFLKYASKEATKSRGRPKKMVNNITEDETDEIEVTKINIDGIYYYKTAENVLLDINTHDIIGIYKNETIIRN